MVCLVDESVRANIYCLRPKKKYRLKTKEQLSTDKHLSIKTFFPDEC